MAISDLVFLICLLACAILFLRLAWLTIRGPRSQALAAARDLGGFVGVYAVLLIGFALLTPRRVYARAEPKCFDDWCVAAQAIEHQPDSGLCPGTPAVWVVSIDVLSVARRVRQRAPDASVELEDAEGHRYSPCSAGAAAKIRDYLEPGQSISISLPFGLPASALPAGLVVHHGAFPGVIIIGDDQSWLHPPALLRLQ